MMPLFYYQIYLELKCQKSFIKQLHGKQPSIAYLKINIEYKEVDKTHELVKIYDEILNADRSAFRNTTHSRGKAQKYYIITGQTYKKMLMTNETGNSALGHFYKRILFKKTDNIDDYIINVDYKAIDKDNELTKVYEEVYSTIL